MREDWYDYLVGKRVLVMTHESKDPSVITGFVTGKVVEHNDDEVIVDLRAMEITVHRSYVHVVNDDEDIPCLYLGVEAVSLCQ